MEQKSKKIGVMPQITIVFVLVVIFLIFISRTIYEYNLPAVTVAYAESGYIINSTTAEAAIVLEGEKDIISENDGIIDIFVEQGNQVTAGSLLYTIERDLSGIEDDLEKLNYDRDLLLVAINKTQSDIAYLLNNPPDGEEPVLDLSTYDFDMEQLEISISLQNDELERLNILFEQGIIPESEIREQRDMMEELQRKLNKVKEDRQRALEDYRRLEEDIEKSVNRSMESWNKSIKDLNYSNSENTLKLNHINTQIADLQNQLENEGIVYVYAESDGTVTQVYENARSGRYIGKNIPVLSFQAKEDYYKVTFSLNSDIDYIAEGDSVELRIRSKNLHNIEGTVDRLYYSENKLMAEVVFEAEGLNGGERAEARFQKASQEYEYVLPNSAIREGEHYYVLYAEQVKTSYGYDYIVKSRYISIAEQGKSETAVIMGNYKNEAIIINSNRPVMEDSKVKIVGGSDIVEIR